MPNKTSNTPSYEFLRDKWIEKHKNLQKNLIEKHKDSVEWLSNNTKQLALGSLAGLTILTSPIPKDHIEVASEQAQSINSDTFIVADLSSLLPDQMRPLTGTEEASVSAILSKDYGVKVTPDVGGLRLNRTYGLIGAEQHLKRFPGDSMETHLGNSPDPKIYSSGMAPGLGAFGYFATSEAQMTPEDVDREKYYIAVQTFFSPDFNQKIAQYRDFYRYRKMLIVNPQNGKAMVVVVGDAGPAEWTGKHLGGSPEVMNYLQRQDGSQRGPVLYFFLDDANDTIPLGPIEPVQ